MRVLMTTDTVGGVWTFTQELSLGLLNKGCAVALVSLGRKPAPAQAAWAQQQVVRWGSRFRYEPLDAALLVLPEVGPQGVLGDPGQPADLVVG